MTALPRFAVILPIFAIPFLCCVALVILVGNALDYKMYFFLFSLIILMILQIYRHDYTFRIGTLSAFSKRTVDYVLIVFSSVTLISNYFDNPMQLMAAVTSTITVFFIPGWVLLRSLENKKTFHKKGPLLALSFALSIALSGLITTFSILLQVSSTNLAAVYFAVSLIPLLKYTRFFRYAAVTKTISCHQSEFKLFDVLLLVWILIFFFFVIAVFYPGASLYPGTDIVRLFSQANSFLLAPDISISAYPWYHFLLASVLQLSSSTMVVFQSIIACLSFMLILCFYTMARAYLVDLDSRAPVLATVLFSVFAGFGWLYFLEKVPNHIDIGNNIPTINLVSAGTLQDIDHGQGGWIWFWFRPLTLGLIILFVLFYLLIDQKLSKNRYILICSLLLVALTQVHISEFVIFVVLIFILTIFIPRIRLRLRETSLPIIIAVVVYLTVGFSYSGIFLSTYFSPQLAAVLVVLACIIFILSRYTRRPALRSKIKLDNRSSIILTLSVLFVYLVLLYHWFLDTKNFDDYTSLVKLIPLYAVPPQFYPMLLGVTGVAAIIGIPILLKRRKDDPVTVFIIMFILMILIGRALTYIGAEFSLTGYFEKRTLFFVFTAACMLAPFGIFAIVSHLDSKQLALVALKKSHIASITFVSFLVVIGTLSTFLSIVYQIGFLQKYATTESAIEALQKTIQSNPYSTLLTVSQQSHRLAGFSSPGYLIGSWSDQIWPSRSPELPLNVMSIFNNSFIYTQGRDNQIIKSYYSNGYLNEHILQVAPVVHTNGSQKIVQLPKLSPPVSSSDLVLVMPDFGNLSQSAYFAYDILSLGGYNYTTVLVSDIPSLRNAKVVVTPNEYIASKMIYYKKEYSLQYEKLIVLNLDGYGRMWGELTASGSRNLLPSSSIRVNSTNTDNKTETLLLPSKMQMVPFVTRGNSELIASFENTDVPFVLEKKGVDGLDIFYVNINPVVQNTLKEQDKSGKIYDLLRSVLDFLPVNLPTYDTTQVRSPASLVSGGVAAFVRVSFEGKIEANSSSAIMNIMNGVPIELIVEGRKSIVEDVSRIVPISIQNLIVRGDSGGIIDKGYGFYSSLVTNRSSITAVGKPATILIETNKNDQSGKAFIVTGKEIHLNLDRSSIVLRQPKVIFDGVADFTDFYAYGELYNKLPLANYQIFGFATDQDIYIEGKGSFEVEFSDEFTIVSPTLGKLSGLGQHRYQYDELESLLNIFSPPYIRHLAVLLVLLAIIGVYLLDKQKPILKRNL